MYQRLLSKIFNINLDEGPRVVISWVMSFLVKVSLVIGWTVLVATFLRRIGMELLPFLFILNGLMTMIGTYLYSAIIHRLKKERLIVITCIVMGILLVSTMLITENAWLFMSVLIVAQAVFLNQLNILLAIYIEEMFSPLESIRTFPLIESSQTIGGICAGAIISLFSNYIATAQFVHLWTIAISMIMLIVIVLHPHQDKLPNLLLCKKQTHQKNAWERIKQSLKTVKKKRFLTGLIIVIAMQWIFANLLEFQYTKAIHENITNTQEKTIIFSNRSESSIVSSDFGVDKPTPTDYEKRLTFNLGTLHIVFNSVALIIQLLLASRILRWLGIVGTMMINPLVDLLSMVGLTLKYSFATAVSTKTVHEASHTLFQNAYFTSYYNLSASSNKEIKELVEGGVKPLGALIGMGMILLFQKTTPAWSLTFDINLLMTATMLIAVGVTMLMRPAHTSLVKEQINENSHDPEQRISGISALAQTGHKKGREILLKMLQDEYEKPEIKVKILQALGEKKEYHALPEILDCVENTNKEIRRSAIESLCQFKNLGKHVYSQAFSKHRVLTTFKTLFEQETSEDIRPAIIEALSHLDENDIAPLIINTLHSTENLVIRADCIYLCSLFNDPSLGYYLKRYLRSKNLKMRVYTIIALWKFKKLRPMVEEELNKIFKGKDPKTICYLCFIIGELKLNKYRDFVEKYKNAHQKSIQREAALALTKLGSSYAEQKLAELLLDKDIHFVKKTKQQVKMLPYSTMQRIKDYLNQQASKEINHIVSPYQHSHCFETLPIPILNHLKFFYERAEANHEVYRIEEFIRQRENSQIIN